MAESAPRFAQVVLRDVRASDLEVFHRQEQDPEAVRRAAFRPRERAHFMRHWRERILADPDVMVRTVLADDAVAGSVVSWTQGDERRLGYWLGREFWGGGVGTRAVRLYLEHERTRPLVADPVATNTGSVRLLEKVGFRRAGTRRIPSLVGPGDLEHLVLILD